MSAQAIPRLSPEEYLAIERSAQIKSEYHDGVMFALSGGSLAHSFIPLRLASVLIPQLDGKDRHVSSSDLRVQISPKGPFVYPDLAVHCGKAQLADDYKDILLNPKVVFEVLSQSSEAYDRGQKFTQYRQLESLREYVLVAQTEPRMEVFAKAEIGKWILSEFVGLDAVCQIQSIECEVPLAEVYRDVPFEAA